MVVLGGSAVLRLAATYSLSRVRLTVDYDGISFKAHRLVYHSTLGWGVIKTKKKDCRPDSGHLSVTLSEATPLCSYSIAYRGTPECSYIIVYWDTPVCSYNIAHTGTPVCS